MATLKHINSKNADYGAAEQYLLFEHDEFTMKPVLDETGRLIPREDYRLSTLNCDCLLYTSKWPGCPHSVSRSPAPCGIYIDRFGI